MNLAYYSDFKSVKGNSYRVEFYIKQPVSTVKELLLSSMPFSAEWEADSVYKPLKMSNAVISLLTGEVLKSLYTGEAHGVEVRLYNRDTITLEWFGFVTPNLYSSDYVTRLDAIDIEAIDSIACLDNIKYSYIGERGDFRSFLSVIKYVLGKADPNGSISKMYVQKCNTMRKNSEQDILESLFIHERNFFDEENEPMTCRDVLQSLTAYLGATLMQWKDAYYIVDYDYINNGFCDFFLYSLDGTGNSNNVEISLASLNVSEIGVAASNGSISLDNVYNKVSLIASANPVGELRPDLFDEDDVINQNSDPNKYYISTQDINGKNYTLLNAYFKSRENYTYLKPNVMFATIDELTNSNIENITSGTFWQKTDNYETENEPSSLDWKSCLTFFQVSGILGGGADYLYLALNIKPIIIYKGGYLIIDLEYMMSRHAMSNSCLKTSDETYSNTNYGDGFEDTRIPCKLAIGNSYYYDGENWISYDEYNLKVTRGYYENVGGACHYKGSKWYRIKNNYGYWQYVTQTTFNSSVSEKQSGDCIANKMHYFTDVSGNKVFVERSYYFECLLQDRFFLVHINKEGDKVFDETKSLTNTVSWRFNLTSSADGVAIKLPDMVLFGELTFMLYTPNHLGVYPMYRTDGGCNPCQAFHISDLSITYSNHKSVIDIFSMKDIDTDILYNNVINEDYVTEFEDVDLLVNSYAKGVFSYSNVATKIDGKFDYLESVFNYIANSEYLPEQILIDKLHRHHSTPKFIYKNTLNYRFSPFDRIKENSLDATMIINAFGVDYANDSVDVTLIEL